MALACWVRDPPRPPPHKKRELEIGQPTLSFILLFFFIKDRGGGYVAKSLMISSLDTIKQIYLDIKIIGEGSIVQQHTSAILDLKARAKELGKS